MWRSVPQMPACVTPISTSRGPMAGTEMSRQIVRTTCGADFFKPVMGLEWGFAPVSDREAGRAVAVPVAISDLRAHRQGEQARSFLSNDRSVILDPLFRFARFRFQYIGAWNS